MRVELVVVVLASVVGWWAALVGWRPGGRQAGGEGSQAVRAVRGGAVSEDAR